MVGWFKAENIARFRNISLTVINAIRSRLDVDNLRIGFRDIADHFGQVTNRDAVPSTDVDRLTGGLLGGGCKQACFDDVVDVEEVSSLRSITLDGDVSVRAYPDPGRC